MLIKLDTLNSDKNFSELMNNIVTLYTYLLSIYDNELRLKFNEIMNDTSKRDCILEIITWQCAFYSCNELNSSDQLLYIGSISNK